MPFASEAQRRWMYANHPEIAARWEAEYGPKPKRRNRKRRSMLVDLKGKRRRAGR